MANHHELSHARCLVKVITFSMISQLVKNIDFHCFWLQPQHYSDRRWILSIEFCIIVGYIARSATKARKLLLSWSLGERSSVNKSRSATGETQGWICLQVLRIEAREKTISWYCRNETLDYILDALILRLLRCTVTTPTAASAFPLLFIG